MAVFRVERIKDYTVMSNHHLRNKNLSLKAKGLLSQMLSLPDDWDYTLKGLAAINKESVDAIRTAIWELEDTGYVVRTRVRDERGCLRGCDYYVYEYPQASSSGSDGSAESVPPMLEPLASDSAVLGNPMQLNKEIQNKEKQNTDLILSEGAAVRTKVRDNIELDLLCRNQPESAPVMQEIYELVVVNPNVIHTEVSFESHPLEYIVLGIEGLEFTISDAAEGSFCIYTFKEDNDVLVCMRKILREMQNRESSFQILCQAYMDIIVVQLMRNASVSAVPIHSRLPANRQCATVKRYIDHHYKENITLDQLAEKVSITKYYMVHAFKREYGVSPINYIINCRIKEGKRLLAETDLSLSQIAAILGFSSSSYFSQTFRNAEGTSPTEYRKANQVKF